MKTSVNLCIKCSIIIDHTSNVKYLFLLQWSCADCWSSQSI